jgi:membrane associated rhomboid family serine protease
MFPLRDENPTELAPVVTVAIIAINVLVWLFLQRAGTGTDYLTTLCAYGAIPGSITGSLSPGDLISFGPRTVCAVGSLGFGSVFTAMFMHGGWMHLIGNMWFLWVFGNNIEDSMGHVRFAVFYLATGVIAAAAHIATDPSSAVPMVGASGAISGVMGAYIVLYPKVRVHTLLILIFFIQIVALPAYVLLGLWFALQFFSGLGGPAGGGGVAFWAHVGGFVAGVALVFPFRRAKLVRAKREHRRLTREELGRWERW